MLSNEEVAHYHENGYVTPSFRLSDAQIDSIREKHRKLLLKHPEFSNYCPSLLAYDLDFLDVAKNNVILDMVAQLIGPDIALWNSSFFAKPAGGGHATPWHQDGEYWPIRPLATCTVWIALDPATPENGCLEVIPGSHKQRTLLHHNTSERKDITLNQELDTSQYNAQEALPIVLDVGQVSLHDVYIVHGSASNNSTQSRRGMTLRFMPTSSIYDRELASSMSQAKGLIDQSERTLYLMRGSDASGKNDFSQRH